MFCIVGLLTNSNEVLIGIPKDVRFPTNDNADLLRPSFATNLSFASSVAIVIKEEIISCFLTPSFVLDNFSLKTPKSL